VPSALALVVVLAGRSARAQPPTRAEGEPCESAYEAGQLARKKGELRRSLTLLRQCASDACPMVYRRDCLEWGTEVERAMPTLTVSAVARARDVVDATLFVDGELITTGLDGRAIALDPGRHTIRLEISGRAPTEQTVMLVEGVKARTLVIEVPDPLPTSAQQGSPPDVGSARPVPWPVFALGALGAAGLASFAYFGATGLSKRSDLVADCGPTCPDSRVDPVETRFLIADVSLAVSVVALGAAAYFFFTRPVVTKP
jgi:hypothetical protein